MSDEDTEKPPEDVLDDGARKPDEGDAAEADPFAELKAQDAAAEAAAAEAAAPSEADDADPFAELKAQDAAAEAAAAEAAAPSDAEDANPFAELKAQDAAAEAAAAEAAGAPAVTAEGAADSVADDAPPEQAEAAPAPEEAAEAEGEPAFRYDEKLYGPVSDESPAGKALEFYHFSEMEQELAWPRNEFDRPDPEQRPNFRAVKRMALDFLNGAKDIKPVKDVRPLLCLMTAEAGDTGPVGLAKAVDLFVANATTFWDELHPQKEDEDDDELMTRMEEMRKYFNPQIIGLAVESVPFARSARVGELTTRTFGIASAGLSPRTGEFAPDSDAINALFEQEPEVRDNAVEAYSAYRHGIRRLQEFREFLDDHPDVDPVDIESVVSMLETCAGYIAPFTGDPDAVVPTDDEDGAEPGEAAALPAIGPKTLDEAVAMMDDILAFYAARGRSSPVPLALLAIRDLTYADFNAWIAQTAASGLAEAAINITSIDATRLAEFAPGDMPAAAPAAPPPVELDLSELDTQIANMVTAIGYAEMAADRLQPPEGEEGPPLADEIAGLKSVLDSIRTARESLGPLPVDESAAAEVANEENSPKGDTRHSRITSRNDVKASLDLIAAFFEREEPSSPAPGYLKRLRSLVDARFTDIARDLMGEDGYEPKLRLEPRGNLR